MPKIPSQCKLCANFNIPSSECSLYEMLPGEYTREDIVDCPSFYESDQEDDLKLLAKYIDEDKDHLVETKVSEVVNKILTGYDEKLKIMIVGIARRKIKAMVRMVDIIDTILDRLAVTSTIEEMSNGQMIRLLSELNHSINNDLTFIMKLVNPDTKLQDLQLWIDARSVINVNGASKETELKSEEILSLTSVSRDKIRDAFDAILNNIKVPGTEEEYEMNDSDREEVESI